MSDLNIDLKKFAENAKKIKKVKEDFLKCFNAEAHELEKSIKKLFGENEQLYIYNEIVKLNIESISFPKVGRLHTIFNYIEQSYLKKYFDNFLNNYTTKELPKQPTRPETGSDKDVIAEFNKEVKKWQDETKVIKEWNNKYNTMKEYLESIITVDLYGDVTVDVTDLPYVYFKFLNTDIDEIEVFMQELKTCPAPPVKKIKTIRIEDISYKLPDFLKSANEVRVYFNTDKEANELHDSKDYVEGVYEKYVIKNDIMKKDGGEWGLYNQRKDNLNNSVIGGFSLQGIPTPLNLNSGNSATPNEVFYNNDYEVDISDCYYGKISFDDEEVIAIIPKDFWEKYGTVLVNPNMKIIGITDNKSWKREDIFFKSYDTVENAEEYLNELCEYSEEITNYLKEESNLSPFRKVLKDFVKTSNFNDGWIDNADIYELTTVKNFPTCKDLYNKLSDIEKQTMWNKYGFNNETDFLNDIDLDEEQDFENCEIEYFDDDTLTIYCGGDWQQPAYINFGLVNGNIEVIDYFYDMNGISNMSNIYLNEDEDEDEGGDEDIINEIYVKPNECYWAIDYMDEDGEFYLTVTPKTEWINNQTICEEDLVFEYDSKNYLIQGNSDDGYTVTDKKDNNINNLLLIVKIMKDLGFEFSNELQKEFVGISLNGKRVIYDTNTDDEYFIKASIEFSEYLYNLHVEEHNNSSTISNNNDDIKFAFSIEPYKNIIYLSFYKGLLLPEVEQLNKLLLKGYKICELSSKDTGLFQLLYENNIVVNKISEIKIVLDKSGFKYSWELQKNIDNYMSFLNSNDYVDEKEYINTLKVRLGQ